MGKFNFRYDQKESKYTVHLNESKGVTISRESKERMIEEGLEFLANNSDESNWFSATGDTAIFLYRDLDDNPDFVEIMVTQIKASGHTRIKTKKPAPSPQTVPGNIPFVTLPYVAPFWEPSSKRDAPYVVTVTSES